MQHLIRIPRSEHRIVAAYLLREAVNEACLCQVLLCVEAQLLQTVRRRLLSALSMIQGIRRYIPREMTFHHLPWSPAITYGDRFMTLR